jgi:hypothetical protein
MGPELWVAFVVVFVSGGAVGAAGTFLAQWLLGRFDGPPSERVSLEAADVEALRSEVAEMGRQMRNLDARLDFTERLLDGALLTGAEAAPAEARPGEPQPGP